MSSFKSGSGDLDFGEDDEDDEESAPDAHPEQSEADTTGSRETASPSEDSTAGSPSESTASETAVSTPPQREQYPYFIRRNNVGDERDTRLEIHVRDKVSEQEAQFRSELAELLGTSEVAKTDAREFALLAAYQHPKRVAELMQEEGYGALD